MYTMTREVCIQQYFSDLYASKSPSAEAAAKAYGLCPQLIRCRNHHNFARQDARVEQQILGSKKEELLVQWILGEERRSFTPTHARIRDFASRILRLSRGRKPVGKTRYHAFFNDIQTLGRRGELQ